MTDKEKKAIEKISNGEKIELTALIRKFKREGIENFIVTRPEYIYIILNLIKKQQKEIKNSISKDKIRKKMQEYYEKASPYDCDTANYKQSQEIGGWNALRKLLEE